MEPFAPERIGTWILAIAQEEDGTLWFGSAQQGILRARNGEVRTFGLDDGLPSMSVEALLLARGGTLWAGTHAGRVLHFCRPRRVAPRSS
jgi:ligand-binding sensor domain-containing protein